MFSELFWLGLSFTILVLVGYKSAKNTVKSELDERIFAVESTVLGALHARVEAKIALDALHVERDRMISITQKLLEEASVEAEAMMAVAQKKVLSIVGTYEQLIKTSDIQWEKEITDNFKKKALSTLIKLVEDTITQELTEEDRSNIINRCIPHLSNALHDAQF